MDDPNFSSKTYRRGASGISTPVVSGTGVRVQTVEAAGRDWQMSPEEIAADYGLTLHQGKESLGFYNAHRVEIDAAMAVEKKAGAK